MDKEIIRKYQEAGKIAATALHHGATITKEGAKILDIAEAVERKIVELGGRLAFPMNISINQMSAHYTPTIGDMLVIKAEDYVKLDVGVHVDGYIGDTALTIRPAGKDELIKCSEAMLENALKIAKPGVHLSEIGGVIEETAKKFGFNPVRNLTGHSLHQYDLHSGVTVPNIKTGAVYRLKEGDVYAIEPFCTAGAGHVKDSGQAEIFKWMCDKPTRTPECRKILDLAKNNFSTLPFAKRWIKEIPKMKIDMALRQLVQSGALHSYLPLVEISNRPVAQTEHTIIVLDKPIVTTRI